VLVFLFFLFVLWLAVGALAPGGLAGGLGAGRGRSGSPEPEETRTSLFSWRRLVHRLRARLAGLWARIRGRLVGASCSAAHTTNAGAGAAGSVLPPVRQHYRELLLAARRRGLGRRPTETPLEFGDRLRDNLEGAQGDHLSELTHLYDEVRYGSRPAEVSDHRRAELAVRDIIDALLPERSPPPGGPSSD
jgi:hypothetical protein